jgi:hypothetical protein
MEKAWLAPPFGIGDPKEFEATLEILTPLMVAGWSQCDPPQQKESEVKDVDD